MQNQYLENDTKIVEVKNQSIDNQKWSKLPPRLFYC